MAHICNTLPELNAPHTALLSQVEVQSLRDRVIEASAELVEVGAPEGPPLLPLVAEVAESNRATMVTVNKLTF